MAFLASNSTIKRAENSAKRAQENTRQLNLMAGAQPL